MNLQPPRQLSLFDSPALLLGGLGRAVKLALNRAARESRLSREEVAHRAARLADEAGVALCPGGSLGVATLNKWLDVNAAGHTPSLLGLAVLCQVLETAEPLAPVLEYLNLEAIGPEDRKYRDLGKLEVQLKCLRKKKRQIEASE